MKIEKNDNHTIDAANRIQEIADKFAELAEKGGDYNDAILLITTSEGGDCSGCSKIDECANKGECTPRTLVGLNMGNKQVMDNMLVMAFSESDDIFDAVLKSIMSAAKRDEVKKAKLMFASATVNLSF